MGPVPGLEPVSECVPCTLGVDAGEQWALLSPVFGLWVHRGHQNLPRKIRHACELAGHATLVGGAGQGCRHTPVPGYFPTPGARAPGGATDEDTEAQRGEGLSRSSRGLG